MQRKPRHVENLRRVGAEQQACSSPVQFEYQATAPLDTECCDFSVIVTICKLRFLGPCPFVDRLAWHVAHFRSITKFADRRVVDELLDEHLRRHVPDIRLRGRLRNLGDSARFDLVGQEYVEKASVPAETRTAGRQERDKIAVEMIDRRLPFLEDTTQPCRHCDMSGKRETNFPGRVGESKEFLFGQARMNLRKVVAGSVLICDHPPGLRRAAHRPTIQRWSRRNESWTENGVIFEVGAQPRMRGAPEHASDCRNAIRDIEIEIAIQRLRPGVRNVRVHLGQPGH